MIRNIYFAAGLLTMFASVASADDWEWIITPYLWASDISTAVSVNDEPVFGADVSFEDLIDKIDFAKQLHFEGHRGKVGFILDVTYINLSDKQTTVANSPLPDDTVVQTDLSQTLVEVGGFYRPSGETHGFDLLFGVRVIDYKMELDISPPEGISMPSQVTTAVTVTDAFAGLRYKVPLGGNWSIVFRGDIGVGDSERTLNSSAFFGYQFGKNRQNTLLIGYRHMEIEFKESHSGLAVRNDVTMSGPSAGFMARF